MPKVIIPATQGILAYEISKRTGITLSYAELEKFPDGEKYVRVSEAVKGSDVFIVNSFHHMPDEMIIETIFLIDIFKSVGANEVVGIFPYFPYSRFRRFIGGEANRLKTISKLFRTAGLNKMYVVDFHLQNVEEFFDFEVINISAMPLLADYVKRNFELEDAVVVGADEVAEFWARIVSEKLGTDYKLMRKIRIDAENVIIDSVPDVSNRDVVLVDDIISTGGTVVQAIKALRHSGAKRIYAVCTHPLLSNEALKLIYRAGIDGIVGTDTVLSPISHVSVAEIISEEIRKRELDENKS
ncbi:ribose-phosphate pyrophosphokinase [Archaeoglobus sulfaticallidus PM70-1]|uniref:ribose-phosphate diphosphokinase n=1 Tax=Archaeoglobus sulfaticallidus PM70-1 TaxID=387631 RepID=N0BEV9_9EURY|nr:ribose-phosphate diphosphokinase [Archaeoglobus sulfaticallidus]AGK61528.1 ribose-phosphate pyrophosphokinase [Archaeoglobus sulfaticallidus PM70-1]